MSDDWELIGYIEHRSKGVEANLENVPSWILNNLSRAVYGYGSHYFRGRTFLYRVDFTPSEFDKPNVYIYRKLKYKPRRKRFLKASLLIPLIVLALAIFYSFSYLFAGDTSGLVSNLRDTIRGSTSDFQRSLGKIVKMCEDGTLEGFCSAKKPLFCENGSLVAKASVCGCPEKYVPDGNSCVYALTLHPETRELKYCFSGRERTLQITVYGGLNEYLSKKSKRVFCEENYYIKTINDVDQREAIKELVQKIQMLSNNKDEQARIAISLVQKLEYDYEKLYGSRETYLCRNGYLVAGEPPRYPYQVLYDKKGVCNEKSRLLALLLKELGFGVVLLLFEDERHMAVGIKCFEGLEEYANYRYNGSGYCFIESTISTIVTYDKGEYVGVGVLRSYPKIIPVSDGLSFDSVWIEYNDAKEWQRLKEVAERNNNILSPNDYAKWKNLVEKYCMEIGK